MKKTTLGRIELRSSKQLVVQAKYPGEVATGFQVFILHLLCKNWIEFLKGSPPGLGLHANESVWRTCAFSRISSEVVTIAATDYLSNGPIRCSIERLQCKGSVARLYAI